MSVESNRELDFQRYLEHERQRRGERERTLGGFATVLALSMIDLGLSPVAEADSSHPGAMPTTVEVEGAPLVAAAHRPETFAADHAELGYARAA